MAVRKSSLQLGQEDCGKGRVLTLAVLLVVNALLALVFSEEWDGGFARARIQSSWDQQQTGTIQGNLNLKTIFVPLVLLQPSEERSESPTATPMPTQTVPPTLTQTTSPSQTPTPTGTASPSPTPTSTPPSSTPMPVTPGETWLTASPEEVGMDSVKLRQARDFALTGGGSGYITRYGRLVLSWGSSTDRYSLKSSTKSIGATLLGLALLDGRLGLEDLAQGCHPSLGILPERNASTSWLDEITLLHLSTHTAGFDKSGGYTELLFQPGTAWSYSDGGSNWLAECLTLEYGQDLNTLLFERVLTPLGITPSDLVWRSNQYREDTIEGIKNREFGSGISANVDAMARIGYLFSTCGMGYGVGIACCRRAFLLWLARAFLKLPDCPSFLRIYTRALRITMACCGGIMRMGRWKTYLETLTSPGDWETAISSLSPAWISSLLGPDQPGA